MKRSAQAALLVSALGLTLYMFTVLFLRLSSEIDTDISSGLLILIQALVFYFSFRIYFKWELPTTIRRAWIFFGLAALNSAIAEIIWIYYKNIAKVNPSASWPDVFYLLFYPFIFFIVLNKV